MESLSGNFPGKVPLKELFVCKKSFNIHELAKYIREAGIRSVQYDS